MRAFLTGSDGFVGRHLTAHLEAEGDEVAALPAGLDITDRRVAEEVVAAGPDVVFHLAALSHVGASFDDPAEAVRVNVGGTAAVCEAARQAGARVIVVGSSDAYGPVPMERQPITEDEPLAPVSPYGASKAAAELVALQSWRAHGTEVVLTRSFNHTGPGQSHAFVVPAFASRIAAARAEGRDEIAVGDLSAARDLLDVDDVVRAYRLLALRGEPGRAYNVCSGRAVAIGDIADRLVAVAGGGIRLVQDPRLVRPVGVARLEGSNARLGEATGWAPTIDLDATLRRVWASVAMTTTVAPRPADNVSPGASQFGLADGD